jgi:hypothetical protein
MVDLDQLLKREVRNAYWIVDDGQDEDSMVFTNLNLSKAEKALEEMGIMEQEERPETIFVDFEAADQITPDLLEKIIFEEDKADWPEDLDEQIERRWHMQERKINNESSRISWPTQSFFGR